ncbi:DUF4192 family protein [Streptomyces sp. NPDC003077]|uniref:DUF4192 domain-containing protein n=1 Tax=Streptomyces sp. NPDC003077 TaxID=3154443 RepID=UPI0033A9266B
MNQHIEPSNPSDPTPTAQAAPGETRVTLRSPAELADALPYLLGFYPDNSVVLVGLHGDRARFGGRVRLGIPADSRQWPDVSEQLADCVTAAGRLRGNPLRGIIVYLCQEPGRGETGRDVMERLRPLAQRLRTACGALDVPVLEALCLSDGRFWSYCCPDYRCCPKDGNPMVAPGTSVMAAAAAYTGLRVRGSLREMEARLTARTGPRAQEQEKALDTAARRLLPRMLDERTAAAVRHETLALTERLIHRFRLEPSAGSRRAKDACDDAIIEDREAAAMIIGLQDRVCRDRAAEWMEGADGRPALRLWRALCRRCVGGYDDHAVAPLTLVGWVAWATGDEPFARVALARALRIDPEYVFAQLLYEGINGGIDPEPLRNCLREERDSRSAARPADDDRAAPVAPAASQASAWAPPRVPVPEPLGPSVRERPDVRSRVDVRKRADVRKPGSAGTPRQEVPGGSEGKPVAEPAVASGAVPVGGAARPASEPASPLGAARNGGPTRMRTEPVPAPSAVEGGGRARARGPVRPGGAARPDGPRGGARPGPRTTASRTRRRDGRRNMS